MNKKIALLALLSLLLLVTYVPNAWAHPPNPTDPAHLVIDTIEKLETTDPAWANDKTSSECIQNVYETLTFFDRDYTLGPYQTGKTDLFVPKLATLWSIMPLVPPEPSPEGLWWYWRYIFTIRAEVKWHDSVYGMVTPEDVEYSFERLMVQDRLGGPSWIIYQPLLNVAGAVDPVTDPLFGLKIDHAVESDATSVWFSLANPDISSSQFLKILSHTLGSVVNKMWCQEHGDLNVEGVSGGWNNWQYIWDTWHNPPMSFIEYARVNGVMASGPFKFDYAIPITPGYPPYIVWSVVQFVDYWDGWPARVSDDPNSALYDERLMSFVSRVTWHWYPEWATRRVRFLVGDSDQTVVPEDKITIDQLLSSPGIRCFYPLGDITLERHWERDWMRGWYYNSLYPGEYAYHRWKAVTHFGDANNDGAVNIVDVSYISAHWYPGPPIGLLGYNPNADINGGTGGVVCGGSGPVKGIPDGKVGILDLALVSAYWDGPPSGPSHP